MGKQGKYIYGIIPDGPDSKQVSPDDAKSFGPYGITACEEVYVLPYKNIRAVVSDSEIVDYTHMRKDALAMFLVRHQRAIEKIMASGYTVIPVKLGTFAQDENEVKDILVCSYSIIKDITSKISDKVEIDIVATWNDFTSVLKEAGEEKEIKQLKERLLANPKQVSIDDQMKVGFMVKKALDEKRVLLAEEIQNVLKNIAQGATRAHELMDDKMVMNAALLIDKRDQTLFYKKVEELNDKFAEKLNFRCVGPLPPYSFYTLEIKKMRSEDVDWAKKKIGLNNITNKEEVKKAYRRSAFSSHPDKNPNMAGAEKEFDEVNRAYKILVEYCEACEQIGEKKDAIYFKEGELGHPAILVKVRE